MKVHRILLVLTLTSFLVICIGCSLYYSYLKKTSIEQAKHNATANTLALKNRASVFISENIKLAKALAGFKEIQQLLENPTDKNVQQANTLLDYFNGKIDTDVCYVMDFQGTTLASSNRNDPESFVGKNYVFRPYFMKAIRGDPGVSIYLALGITSQVRGIYYSFPVYSRDNQIIGCSVIKVAVARLETRLNQTHDGQWGLVSPHGIIIASSTEKWLYHSLWHLPPQKLEEIKGSKQFGPGPWNWIGIKPSGAGRVIDTDGKKFLLHQIAISHYTDWQIFYLTDIDSVLSVLSDPLIKNRGLIALVLFLLAASLVLTLYYFGRMELLRTKKIEQALQMQNEYLSALHDASLGLIKRLHFDDLMETILSRAGTLAGTANGVLSLYDPDRDVLEIRIGLGIFKKAIGNVVKPGEGFSGKIWQSEAPLIIDDYATWPGRLPTSKFEDLHSLVGIPIKSGSKVLGIIGLAHNDVEKKFGTEELDILDRFSQLVAIALDNAHLYSELQKANFELKRIATIDGLTKIANRRFFDEFLQKQWKLMLRDKSVIGLIMCDIDYFKLYNDTYGHQQGDECLKNIATVINNSLNRPTDLVARYGGEEFVVVLPDTSQHGAMRIAETIRKNTELLKIEHRASDITPHVTLSLGVSSASPDNECTLQQLIAAADAALYKAKEQGRNRVCFFDPV